MSLMKRFMDDTEYLRDEASVLGWMDNDDERFRAVHKLFQECGEMAKAYADPMAVARLLVSAVTDSFYAARQVARVAALV